MNNIGFIGLGNMGTPMVLNLLAANLSVKVFDIDPINLQTVKDKGAITAESIAAVCQNVDVIITMLPAGEHVKQVYLGPEGIFAHAQKTTVLIDCSTIDIETSRLVHVEALTKEFILFDAPVSGGTAGAAAGTLTFMVGGGEKHFHKISLLLTHMGKNIFYAGEATAGQASKICNNLMLAVHMIGTAEGLILGKKLGLDMHKLYKICTHASGESWSLSKYCPMPGIMPDVPSSNDFKPGFMGKMMLKDLNLAQGAADFAELDLPMMQKALALYQQFCDQGNAEIDFSAIIKMIGSSK